MKRIIEIISITVLIINMVYIVLIISNIKYNDLTVHAGEGYKSYKTSKELILFPKGIVVDSIGNIYVANYFPLGSVQVF